MLDKPLKKIKMQEILRLNIYNRQETKDIKT